MNEPNGSNANPAYHYPPPPPPAPGKGMIKVTGILLIIFGTIGFMSGVSTLNASFLGFFLAPWELLGMSHGAYIALTLFGLLTMALYLAFGIFGVSNAGKAAKARIVMIMGIIMCALTVIDLIATIVVTDMSVMGRLYIEATILGTMLSLVLPILYIVGGSMSKRSLQAQP